MTCGGSVLRSYWPRILALLSTCTPSPAAASALPSSAIRCAMSRDTRPLRGRSRPALPVAAAGTRGVLLGLAHRRSQVIGCGTGHRGIAAGAR